jgi:copper homeostasis protein
VAIAMEAGADRVELCSVWSVGGLTPSVVAVQSAVAMGMPTRALIRPREGHFVHSPSERIWSVEEAKLMMDCGAECVVVGGLSEQGVLDRDYLNAMCDAVDAEQLVWHRAIDMSTSPEHDAEVLLEAGVTKVLTSGGAPHAVEGLDRIATLVRMGMQVVAGGGVRPEDVPSLIAAGVEGVHASCRDSLGSNESPLFDARTHPVSHELVVRLVDSVKC